MTQKRQSPAKRPTKPAKKAAKPTKPSKATKAAKPIAALPKAYRPTEETLDELDKFINASTHESRNQMNRIALELADITEQASAEGHEKNQERFQQWMSDLQFCTTSLKRLREKHGSISGHEEEFEAHSARFQQFVQKLREEKPGHEPSMDEMRAAQIAATGGKTTPPKTQDQLDEIFAALAPLARGIFNDLSDRLKMLTMELTAFLATELTPESRELWLRMTEQIMVLRRTIDRDRVLHSQVCGSREPVTIETISVSGLRKICTEAARDFHAPHPLEAKPFKISPGVADNVRVPCDKVAAQKCLYEVLNNAFKFSTRGEVVEIVLKTAGPHLVVSITSRGPFTVGKQETTACLGLGYRGNEAKAYFVGSGVGLWLGDTLMNAQGGALEVHPTTTEKRTTVDLRFPLSS
jgi:signal transduction histidine kinase